MQIDSTNSTLLNFSMQDIAAKHSVLEDIIRNCPMKEKEKNAHLSARTIKAALRFPYTNAEVGIKSLLTAFNRMESIVSKQEECYTLSHEIHDIETAIDELSDEAQSLYAKEIGEQKEEIAGHKAVLNQHLLELNTLKVAMHAWQQTLETCLEEQHTAWASFQGNAGQATVNILEQHLKTTLKENETAQLNTMRSIEEVYDRYQELAITPPIAYNKALDNPMNLFILMGYLTGREVMYRGK